MNFKNTSATVKAKIVYTTLKTDKKAFLAYLKDHYQISEFDMKTLIRFFNTK
jgi:hypothetical protein